MNKKNVKTAAQLRDKIAELKLELAFREIEEEAYAMIALEGKADACAAKLMRENGQLSLSADRPAPRREKHFSGARIPMRVMSMCAACLVFFLLGSGAGMAAVSYIQRQAGDFVVTQSEKNLEVRFYVSPDEISVPEIWEGKYFPTDIPEGFALQDAGKNEMIYRNSDGVEIAFREAGVDRTVSIVTENASVSRVIVGMRMVTVIEAENSTEIIFTDGDRILTVGVTAPAGMDSWIHREAALQVTEGVLMLQ